MLVLESIEEEEMKKIHDGSFPLPNLTDPAYIASRTVIDNGSIVAVGLVRVTTEAILIINQSLPRITRARAGQKLVEEMGRELRWRGIHDCHVFVKNPKVREYLRHLGFIDCNAGEPLMIRL